MGGGDKLSQSSGLKATLSEKYSAVLEIEVERMERTERGGEDDKEGRGREKKVPGLLASVRNFNKSF